MMNQGVTLPPSPAWVVTALLCSGEAFEYASGCGYIIFGVEDQSADAHCDGGKSLARPPSWRGLIRERDLLNELTYGPDGLVLDAGPVRLVGEPEHWQQFLERLHRPPRAAILESPGWRPRPIEAHLPVVSVAIESDVL